MKCPICIIDLAVTERQGVEIDYCQKCRGVWLDRGELDKIIEKNSSFDNSRRNNDNDDYDDDDRRGSGRQNKKRGVLGEIFDF